jgi:hypothetical protein
MTLSIAAGTGEFSSSRAMLRLYRMISLTLHKDLARCSSFV